MTLVKSSTRVHNDVPTTSGDTTSTYPPSRPSISVGVKPKVSKLADVCLKNMRAHSQRMRETPSASEVSYGLFDFVPTCLAG